MATTQVNIINLALINIGVSGIASPTEDSPAANAVRAVWNMVLDEVLEAAPWNCAKERRALAQNTTAPIGGDWLYRYDLPSSPYCLRVLRMVSPEKTPYQIVGRYLYCNYDNTQGDDLVIEYIKRIADFSQLSPMVAQAVSLRLAKHVAPLLTELPETRMQSILREYSMIILDARMRNGMENYDAGEEGQTGELSWTDAGRL